MHRTTPTGCPNGPEDILLQPGGAETTTSRVAIVGPSANS